jgi:LuxR family transcriptional regulator, positive regulator of biofilm formation
MNVLVNLCNHLLSQGMSKLLVENGYQGIASCGGAPHPDSFVPDVIIVDVSSLRHDLVSSYPEAKVLLMDTGVDKDRIVNTLLSFPIHGVLSMDTEVPLFKKAVEAVRDGQMWLDNKTLRAFLNQSPPAPVPPKADKVTDRESEIIDYVCRGYTNREIAATLSLSEHTVKAHLNRIFRKLNTSSRSKLITVMLQERKAATT